MAAADSGVLFATVGLRHTASAALAFVDYFTVALCRRLTGAVAGRFWFPLWPLSGLLLFVLGAIINARYLADQRSRLLR